MPRSSLACRRLLPSNGGRPTRSRRPLPDSTATTSSSPSFEADTTRSNPSGSSCSRRPACCEARPKPGSRRSPSSPSGSRASRQSGSMPSTPPTPCGSTSTSGYTFVADLTTRLQLLESDQQQTAEASAQLQRELESRTALANELAGRIEALEAEQVSLRAAADAELAALRSTTEAEQAAIRAEAEAEKARFGSGRSEADRSAVEAERAELRSAAEAEQAALRAALEDEHAAIRGEIESKLQELQSRYGTDTGALRDALNESLSEQARQAEAMAAAEQDAAQKGSQLASLEQALADERSAAPELKPPPRAGRPRPSTARVPPGALRARISHRAYQAERDAARAAAAARTAERDAIHATQIAELEAAHASRLVDLERCPGPGTQRADDALAAVQRAEDAFGTERQRLEDALLVGGGWRARCQARACPPRLPRARWPSAATVRCSRPSSGLPRKPASRLPSAALGRLRRQRRSRRPPRRWPIGSTPNCRAAWATACRCSCWQPVATSRSPSTKRRPSTPIGVFADSRRLSMLGGK